MPWLQLPEEEREGIPHHLIDVITPDEDFSAGSFYHLARQATADILQVGLEAAAAGRAGQCAPCPASMFDSVAEGL